MNIERISIKTPITASLLLFGALAIMLSFVSTHYNRKAAIQSQQHSMESVIEVAAQETIKKLHEHAINLGSSMQANPNFIKAVNALFLRDKGIPLAGILDEPFRTGFVRTADVELVKLRIYDLDFNLLEASNEGIQQVSQHAPIQLLQAAARRQGVERLKAMGGLWSSTGKPLYSVLLPLGGLHIKGYFEIVLDPLFNLPEISTITRLPVNILSISGEVLHQSAVEVDQDETRLPIVFTLRNRGGEPMFRIVAFDTIRELDSELNRTRFIIITAFLSITGITILLTLWLFNRYLFKPYQRMILGMENSMWADDPNSRQMDTHGLREFHTVASSFNVLLMRVQSSMRELQRISAQDGLTGVANRRHFDERLTQEWQRALRQQSEISLLLLDIDSFKLYNDTYGHQAGDQCLCNIAATLAQTVSRSCDLVARYGGEEFVVIAPGTSAAGAINIAENILQEVRKLGIPHKNSEVAAQHIVTVSIGVSTITPKPELAPHFLVAMADKALYEAKEHGRNRLRFARHETDDTIRISTVTEFNQQQTGTITKIHQL